MLSVDFKGNEMPIQKGELRNISLVSEFIDRFILKWRFLGKQQIHWRVILLYFTTQTERPRVIWKRNTSHQQMRSHNETVLKTTNTCDNNIIVIIISLCRAN